MSVVTWIYNRLEAATAKGKPQPVSFALPAVRSSQGEPTIDSFRAAMQQARGGSRKGIVSLYELLTDDAHLTSVMQQRSLATLSRPYRLAGPGGEPAPAAMAALGGNWFVDFMRAALRSVFYGPGLIQLGPPRPQGGFASATAVPEALLWLTAQEVEVDGGKRVRYAEAPYADWAVPVGDPAGFGLLARTVPLLVAKQRALLGWSRYLETFGMPYRVAHTNTQDQAEINRLHQQLQQMGSMGFAIFDQDDRMELLTTQAGAAGQHGYELLCRFADEQLSKLILGQTMTTDKGGSLAQAQVHERTAQALFRADALWLEEIVNTELLPRMERLGMPVAGVVFSFLPDENALPPELKLDLVRALLPHYRIPAQWLAEEFGIEVEEKKGLA